MSQVTQANSVHALMTQLASIRGKERSCDRCGQVKLTLAMGSANFCLGCTEDIHRARKLAREAR